MNSPLNGPDQETHSSLTSTPISNQIWTIPNVLSTLRLAGVPLFLWLLLVPHADVAAIGVLIVSAITDWLDGKLARRWGQVTRVGQLLDPVADRLYIFATLLAFVVRDVVPLWLAIVLIARDVLLGVAMLVLLMRRYTPPEVNFIGKAATFCLLYALPLLLFTTIWSTTTTVVAPVAWAFALWGIGLYWLAGLMYLRQTIELLFTPSTMRS